MILLTSGSWVWAPFLETDIEITFINFLKNKTQGKILRNAPERSTKEPKQDPDLLHLVVHLPPGCVLLYPLSQLQTFLIQPCLLNVNSALWAEVRLLVISEQPTHIDIVQHQWLFFSRNSSSLWYNSAFVLGNTEKLLFLKTFCQLFQSICNVKHKL